MPDPVELRPPPLAYFHLILRHFGGDEAVRDAILEGVGVSADALEDARTEISFSQQMRQIDNMNSLFGEGWVLDAPEIWQPAALGSLGLAVMTSPTVGAGLEVMAKYVQAYAPNQRLRLVRNANELILRNSHAATLPEHHQRFISELVLLSLHSLLEAMLGGARAAARFDFAWPEPVYGPRLEETLGGSARWNASSTAIIVPTRLLAVNSALADPTFRDVALEHLEQMLQSARAPDGVKARVERLLAQSDTGRMSSALAARALSVSQRTLARRLADAGTAHRNLVDAELKVRARESLNDGALSRAEIADRLGFADAIGFSRACRRWFGGEGAASEDRPEG